MKKTHRAAVMFCVALAAGACTADIAQDSKEPTPGARAMFDDTTGVVPLPADLLVDPATGNLGLPISDTDSELTKAIITNLNRTNGWLPNQTITFPVDAPLDPASLTPETVLMFDLTTGAPERLDPSTYYVYFNRAYQPATQAPFLVSVKYNVQPGPFDGPELPKAHRYVVVMTDAVRGADGLPLIGNPAYELFKSTTPLVDADGHSQTFLPDDLAQLLEPARGGVYQPIFDLLESSGALRRENAIAFTSFGVMSNPSPVFVPIGIIQRLPTPAPGSTDAAVSATIDVLFDIAVDPATVQPGSHLYNRTAGLADVPVTASAVDATTVRLAPQALDPATEYLVVLTNEFRGLDGATSVPGSFFSLLGVTTPLIDQSTTPATLNSPFLDATVDVMLVLGNDPTTATQDQWNAGYDSLISANLGPLEEQRANTYAQLFAEAEGKGLARDSIIALWTFTTQP